MQHSTAKTVLTPLCKNQTSYLSSVLGTTGAVDGSHYPDTAARPEDDTFGEFLSGVPGTSSSPSVQPVNSSLAVDVDSQIHDCGTTARQSQPGKNCSD